MSSKRSSKQPASDSASQSRRLGRADASAKMAHDQDARAQLLACGITLTSVPATEFSQSSNEGAGGGVGLASADARSRRSSRTNATYLAADAGSRTALRASGVRPAPASTPAISQSPNEGAGAGVGRVAAGAGGGRSTTTTTTGLTFDDASFPALPSLGARPSPAPALASPQWPGAEADQGEDFIAAAGGGHRRDKIGRAGRAGSSPGRADSRSPSPPKPSQASTNTDSGSAVEAMRTSARIEGGREERARGFAARALSSVVEEGSVEEEMEAISVNSDSTAARAPLPDPTARISKRSRPRYASDDDEAFGNSDGEGPHPHGVGERASARGSHPTEFFAPWHGQQHALLLSRKSLIAPPTPTGMAPDAEKEGSDVAAERPPWKSTKGKVAAPTVPRGTVDKQQDPILNALALAQAPNLWVHFGISDGNMHSHLRGLIANAQSKVRKLDRWWLIVSARALLNQMVDRTLSPDELGIRMISALEWVISARAEPGQHRIPYAPEGTIQFPLNNLPITGISIMTLASLNPTQLLSYLNANNICESWVPWDADIDDPTVFDPAQNPWAWVRTVQAVQAKLAGMMRGGPSADTAHFLAEAYGGPNNGVHPQDAITLINAVEPGRYTPWDVTADESVTANHRAVHYLRDIVSMGHAFNLFCEGFLKYYFFNAWIQLVDTWQDAHRTTAGMRWPAPPPISADNPALPAWEPWRWYPASDRAIQRARQEHGSFMSLDSIITMRCDLDPYMALYYYYGHNEELQRLYPDYLRANHHTQVQMVITAFMLREMKDGQVRLPSWANVLQWGGCAPHTDITSALGTTPTHTSQHLVIAPVEDLAGLIKHASALPPLLYHQHPIEAVLSVPAWTRWASQQRPMAVDDIRHHVSDTRVMVSNPQPDITREFIPSPGTRLIHYKGSAVPVPEDAELFRKLRDLASWYAHGEQTKRLARRQNSRREGISRTFREVEENFAKRLPIAEYAMDFLRGKIPVRTHHRPTKRTAGEAGVIDTAAQPRTAAQLRADMINLGKHKPTTPTAATGTGSAGNSAPPALVNSAPTFVDLVTQNTQRSPDRVAYTTGASSPSLSAHSDTPAGGFGTCQFSPQSSAAGSPVHSGGASNAGSPLPSPSPSAAASPVHDAENYGTGTQPNSPTSPHSQGSAQEQETPTQPQHQRTPPPPGVSGSALQESRTRHNNIVFSVRAENENLRRTIRESLQTAADHAKETDMLHSALQASAAANDTSNRLIREANANIDGLLAQHRGELAKVADNVKRQLAAAVTASTAERSAADKAHKVTRELIEQLRTEASTRESAHAAEIAELKKAVKPHKSAAASSNLFGEHRDETVNFALEGIYSAPSAEMWSHTNIRGVVEDCVVDPTNPPTHLHRTFGAAGQHTDFAPDHKPLLAPRGTTASMDDSIRTSADHMLRNTVLISNTTPPAHVLLLDWIRNLEVISHPHREGLVGRRVVWAQTVPGSHTSCSAPPLTMEKFLRCA
ncbi:hypothetical protein B484DRAFT_480569, partial [Ochromonadaceae sp. CCMP2298]